MPTHLAPQENPPCPEPAPNRLRWTRAQTDAIRDSGVLTGHYELIDGEILSKMGQNPPHAYVIKALLAWLVRLFGEERTQVQSPIHVAAADEDLNDPEPDCAVTAQPYTAYALRHPGPEDLLAVAEVSDSTLRFDLTTKATLYARAGIREYWAVDLNGRRIITHRQPTPEGYQEIVAYAEGEEIALLARPDASIRVADLLPPVSAGENA